MSELTPYLAVSDCRAAIAWYAEALDAVVTREPIEMADGRIGHVELAVDGARWMMADAHPEIQVVAPGPEGSPVTLHLTVRDVDGLAARAQAKGASLDRGPEDAGAVGRVAVFRDPFGHRWFLNRPPT
jgi:PhnB protein